MTFLICECGVNWRCLSEADRMIKEAARAGADAAKFQCYKPDFNEFHIKNIGSIVTGVPGYYTNEHPRGDELNHIALKEEDIRYLYYRCQQHGIEFMCTPFYPEAVEMLNPHVRRWKVRFKDRANYHIVNKCEDTKKEILISVDKIANYTPQFKQLYCVPEYPPKEWPQTLAFKGMDGYSCHTPSWEHAAFTVQYHKLHYLEVHVRLDTYTPAWEPPDQRVSITMSELRKLCKELGK